MAKLILLLASVLLILAGFWMLRDQDTEAAKEKFAVASPKTVPSLNTSISAIHSPISTPISKAGQSKIQQQIHNRISQWYNRPINQVIEENQNKLASKPNDVAAHGELAKIYGYFPETYPQAHYHLQQVLQLEPNHPDKDRLEALMKIYAKPENSELAKSASTTEADLKKQQEKKSIEQYKKWIECWNNSLISKSNSK